jgi:hypothetical protein
MTRWLEAVTNGPLLPGRIRSSDYLGQPAWPVGHLKSGIGDPAQREARRQQRTFKLESPGANLCCICNKSSSWVRAGMVRRNRVAVGRFCEG